MGLIWDMRATMPEHMERAIRYRNYAEELRMIAADGTTADNRAMLLRLVESYEQMAQALEALGRAKKDQGLPL
jgi:hypothetical protein